MNNTSLRDLAHAHGTPLAVFDEDALRRRYNALSSVLRVDKLFYAVKSNPHPLLLRALVDLGSNFEIVALSELGLLVELGCSPDRIIHAHPIRGDADISGAAAKGIRTFVIDDIAGFESLARVLRSSDFRCVLRLRAENGSRRYGFKVAEAVAALQSNEQLRQHTRGVCMHHGPYDHEKDIAVFRAGLDALRTVVTEVRSVAWEIVDVGGGFPDAEDDSDPIFAGCRQAIADAKASWIDRSGLELWSEPGRALSAPAFHLMMKILSRRQKEDVEHYYVDDSIYGSYLDAATFGRTYPFEILSAGTGIDDDGDDGDEPRASVIYGATCDSLDVIAKSIRLPRGDAGDIVLCRNAGAYTTALTDGFNGIRRPRSIHAKGT